MQVTHISGRYPTTPAVLRSSAMQTSIEETAEGVVIRIDDNSQPEFYLKIQIAGLRSHVRDALDEVAEREGG